MRIHKLLLSFFLFLSFTTVFAQENSAQEFRSFLESAAKSRLEQAKKMHELKRELLEEEYESQINMINEINKLSLKMKPGDRDFNKSIRDQIKKKWKAHKELRKDNMKKIDETKDQFKETNKERRRKMKKLMGKLKKKGEKKGESQD